MKLIKQISLFYQEGTSDKVYEVDLSEVGQDRYVVNFRYGRRDTTLREGSKTVSPVSRLEADKIFDKLVTSKMKGGYREREGQPITSTPAASVSHPVDEEARRQAILTHLVEAIQREAQRQNKPGLFARIVSALSPSKSPAVEQPASAWPLERIIWRVGELKITAAAPLLIDLIGSGEALRDYCIIWALGWCGDRSAGPAVRRLYDNSAAPEMVRRIAGEALLKLLDDEAKAEFQANIIERLPPELRELARSGPAGDFALALDAYLKEGDSQRFALLDTIYLLDNSHVRPALLDLLRTAPLRPNYFQRLRHIFKAAEYRRDAETFSILAYRFEKERAMFNNKRHPFSDERPWSYVYIQGRYIREAHKEIRSPSSSIAYSSRTRTYLRRRVWRTLRRLGELGDPGYVQMAAGVLLQYTDADAQPVKESRFYSWATRQTRRVYWDAYAGYWAFNHILYTNSPRYLLKPGSVAWRCQPPYKPGQPAPQIREEAFPRLWEQAPALLLRLVLESNCQPVLHFAVKALNDCRQFWAGLEPETIVLILQRPYEVVARFGFELVKDRYRPETPDHTLILALANCLLAEARAQAHHWIEERRDHFLDDSNFLAALAASSQADTRTFARRLLGSAVFSETAAKTLIARLIAHLLAFDAAQVDLARDLAETILTGFGPRLRAIGLNVVRDLLAHPLLEVQELGGNILLNHDLKANDLPEVVISSLIASPHESIRAIGMQLFSQLSDQTLLAQETLLTSLAMHELPDLRQAVRPVIRRLSLADQEFATRLVSLFIKVLLKPEPHAGVHAGLVTLLREDVSSGWMLKATPLMAWSLIHAQSGAAQELGGLLVDYKVKADGVWAEDFETEQIVALANHEVLAVRQAAQSLFIKVIRRFQQAFNPGRHTQEMARAVRLFDSQWADSRQFWFETFRNRFGPEDFTPAILVSLCDSVREDVQRFGRELISRYFEEAAGQEYLLKLSEHPSAELQSFAADYLERYAAGNLAHLEALRPYFISVLSRVNKARLAKNRVMAFLTTEATKSEAAAQIVAEILARQSATAAIGDKAAALEAMLKIHQLYPHLPLPIQVKKPEARHAI